MKTSKKGKVIITVILIIIAVAFGILINRAIDKLFTNERQIEILKTDECTHSELYYQGQDFNIYTYCISSIKVSNEESLVELKNLFEQDVVMDNFLDDMIIPDIEENDDFTKYIDEDNNLSILKCHVNSNEDIYIGPKDMEYSLSLCKDTQPLITDSEFSITYKVEAIYDTSDENYKFITIHTDDDDFETVKISSVFTSTINLKKNKNYTFTFKRDEAPFENTIKNIFNKSTLLEINPKK